MTDIDYFAAHAPNEIPKWFQPEPVPTELSPGFNPSILQSDEDRAAFWAWLNRDEDLPAHLVWVSTEVEALREARAQAIAEREANRYFAWRWHYAQQMLGARP